MPLMYYEIHPTPQHVWCGRWDTLATQPRLGANCVLRDISSWAPPAPVSSLCDRCRMGCFFLFRNLFLDSQFPPQGGGQQVPVFLWLWQWVASTWVGSMSVDVRADSKRSTCCTGLSLHAHFCLFIPQCLFLFFLLIFIELIGVTLVNEITEVSAVQFYNTPSAHCIVCSPPQVQSPSILIYLPVCPLTSPSPVSLW